jgi:hypothetical protein
MTASNTSTPATSGRFAARAFCVAALAGAAYMAAAPMSTDLLSMTGAREGRSTAPISLASASGGSSVIHSRSTAPAELAGEAPTSRILKRSTAPITLW